MDVRLFFIMPSSTRLLLFSTLFTLTTALPFSGAAPTASYEPAVFVPEPTTTPRALPELLMRQTVAASTCGWIGGASNSPVVCPSGSSCVWDTVHAVVGCCPNGADCSSAIYTACVDASSPTSTSDANARTCGGGNVCYRNSYPGGYYQYGCGVSSQVATIATTFNGQGPNSALHIAYTSIAFRRDAASQTSASTASTKSSVSTSSSTITASSSSSTPSSSTSSTSSTSVFTTSIAANEAAATNSSTPTSSPQTKKSKKSAVIAGSVIGALGVVFAFSTAACLCFRRRARQAHEDFIMQHNIEEKVKYFGNKTSITSRGSSDFTGQSGQSYDAEQGRAFTNASSPTPAANFIPTSYGTPTSDHVNNQTLSRLEFEIPHIDIVSPLTPPQYSGPGQHSTSIFEAHPGNLWPHGTASSPPAPTFSLFSHPPASDLTSLPSNSATNLSHNRGSSTPELRRITLTDAPYNSPTEGLSRSSTVSTYGPPPTPPVRSPMRLTRNSTIAQQMSASLVRSPVFQPLASEPEVQVSQIQVPALKTPRSPYPSYSYATYSQLKEEGESPPMLEDSNDDFADDYHLKANAIEVENALANIHPALRSQYGSNASVGTTTSVFSESSRYSRNTLGIAPQRSTSRVSRVGGRSIAGRSITGRGTTTSNANTNNTLLSNGASTGIGKAIPRKALPSSAAVKAYGELQRAGNLATYLRTQNPNLPVLPPSSINPPPRISITLEDVPLTSIGDVDGAALRFFSGSIRRPERAAEKAADKDIDVDMNEDGQRAWLRPLGEQWRPESRDSNYVAPLRVATRKTRGGGSMRRHQRGGSGVPLLGLPVPGDGRGRMVYDV